MKLNIRNILILTMMMFGTAACTLNFEEINTNPNKITHGDIKAYNCFEPIVYGLGCNSQEYNRFWNNELIQVTAYTSGQTRQEHMYQVTPGNWQSVWDMYARYGGDAQHMIQLAQKDGDKYLEGIGLIFKVYCLSNLASIFGEIPYDEAYQLGENLQPAFETEEVVFGKLIRDLDSANTILARGPKPAKSGLDPVYGDDAAKWRKYANSMKMRLLCRMSNVNDTYWNEIQTMVSNPDKYPVFESNDDAAQVAFKATDPYMSFWGQEKLTKAEFVDYRMTEQVIKMMAVFDKENNVTYNDPRLPVWGAQRGGIWKGTIAGCTEAQKSEADENASILNYEVICRAEAPAILMDYSEILFIYAEGVLKGKLAMSKTAKELYEEAVTANMKRWADYVQYGNKIKPIRDADIKDFLASDLGSFDKAGTDGNLYKSQEEFVLSQKWLALFTIGWEQYHEWRRTEYPILTIGDGTVLNDYELPTRFGYPNFTESSNKEHVAEALQRMGGPNDMHTSLVWSYKKLNGGNHRNPHPNQAK